MYILSNWIKKDIQFINMSSLNSFIKFLDAALYTSGFIVKVESLNNDPSSKNLLNIKWRVML